MLENYKKLVQSLAAEIETYENKPTKAGSLRIRKLSNELGKNGVHLRAHMIALDKKN